MSDAGEPDRQERDLSTSPEDIYDTTAMLADVTMLGTWVATKDGSELGRCDTSSLLLERLRDTGIRGAVIRFEKLANSTPHR